ncbi:hypothetical protein [Rhizobium sp.]|uniref:hypothetical protein n=1 Tax=Rhizobium sp. TaxID=391 RepID=UPI00289FC0E8
MDIASIIAFYVLVVLGLKWAMYNPHPPRPGVGWSVCLLNGGFVTTLFFISVVLESEGSPEAAKAVAAYACGELTGKGYNLFGATHPMNSHRSLSGETSVWEDFWLGSGDVFFATCVVAIPTFLTYWIFGIDLVIWFALAVSAFLLMVKTGVASETRKKLGLSVSLVQVPFLLWAFAGTVTYLLTCLVSYYAIEYKIGDLFVSYNDIREASLAYDQLLIFFFGLLASVFFESIVRAIQKVFSR